MITERGRDKFKKYRRIIKMVASFYCLFPRGIRMRLLEKCRDKTGSWGMAKRYIILSGLVKKIGDNVAIYPHVVLKGVDRLSLGNNVSIQPFSYIDAAGEISIGNDVSIATGVLLISHEHKYDDLTIPIKDQGREFLKIYIQDNVWIGAKATILGGVTVKSGSIVGAMSLVNRNVECNSIVAGIPAKQIKTRMEKARYNNF